jgi:hypothetical protein
VEAQLEGLSLLVLISVVTEVCRLHTSADYFNINTLLLSN